MKKNFRLELKILKLLSILAMSLFLVNCSSISKKSGSTRTPDNVSFDSNGCPKNYVKVPALEGYTKNDFCVMKYEAKNDGMSNAVSQASGKPYVEVSRDDSTFKCTAIGEGYDLISNDEWQTLARNIELVPDNWAKGQIGNPGGLSRGYSPRGLSYPPGKKYTSSALAASNSDDEGCFRTTRQCDNTTWDSQRRTHTLSNGEVIWDVAGNVWEWVKDDNVFDYGPSTDISQVTAASHPTVSRLSDGAIITPSRNAKDQFGPSRRHTHLRASPYGNLGYGELRATSTSGVIRRGGGWLRGPYAGVFAVSLSSSPTPTYRYAHNGFRCVYHP